MHGIRNIGNTCFMNSSLQFLLSIPNFGKDTSLSEFLSTYNSANPRPELAKNIVASKLQSFNNHQQHDAHEWIVNLLDILEGPKNIYNHPSSTENKIGENLLPYQFKLEVDVVFNKCKHTNTHIEDLNHLSLNISESIEKSMEEFMKEVSVTSSCDTCTHKGDAIKKWKIKSMPNYLIVHTKRFTKFGRKINNAIEPNLHEYKLVATVNHMGNQFSGHYTACSYRDGKWWMCNDSKVCEIEERHAIKAAEKAYLLMFKKC